MTTNLRKSTSDDLHLAGDSKQSGGQHFDRKPHPECKPIVGSGITEAQLKFLPEIRDPNRDGQLRLDYVFENLEGVRCQLHPGNKGKDATPIFRQV